MNNYLRSSFPMASHTTQQVSSVYNTQNMFNSQRLMGKTILSTQYNPQRVNASSTMGIVPNSTVVSIQKQNSNSLNKSPKVIASKVNNNNSLAQNYYKSSNQIYNISKKQNMNTGSNLKVVSSIQNNKMRNSIVKNGQVINNIDLNEDNEISITEKNDAQQKSQNKGTNILGNTVASNKMANGQNSSQPPVGISAQTAMSQQKNSVQIIPVESNVIKQANSSVNNSQPINMNSNVQKNSIANANQGIKSQVQNNNPNFINYNQSNRQNNPYMSAMNPRMPQNISKISDANQIVKSINIDKNNINQSIKLPNQNIQNSNAINKTQNIPSQIVNPKMQSIANSKQANIIGNNNTEPKNSIQKITVLNQPTNSNSVRKSAQVRDSKNKSPPHFILSNDGKVHVSQTDNKGNQYSVDANKLIQDKTKSKEVEAKEQMTEIKEISKKIESSSMNKKGKGFIKYTEVSYAGKNQNGERKTNQDTTLVHLSVGNIKELNMYGILDGHGPQGHFVSQFCRDYFVREMDNYVEICKKKGLTAPQNIYNELKKDNFNYFKKIFAKADTEIFKQKKFDSNFSGTTCNIVFQFHKNLVCASVGDSRAILIYDEGNSKNTGILTLSQDHRPDRQDEKNRILYKGGKVEQLTNINGDKVGPMRVWKVGCNYPGLAMSRSLGDFQAKNCGVISEPEIYEYTLNNSSKYMVICSDGVWDFMKNEEVRDLGNEFYKNKNLAPFVTDLIMNASKKWKNFDIIRDDISVVCVYF